MRQLTDGEKVVLLQTLLHDNTFMKRHIKDVVRSRILDGGPGEFIADALFAYSSAHDSTPPTALLIEDLKARIKESGKPEIWHGMQEMWPRLFINVSPAKEYCESVIQETLRENTRESLISLLPAIDLGDSDNRDALRVMVDGLLDRSTSTGLAQAAIGSPFQEGYALREKRGKKRPYCLEWLDTMCGGGGADGDSLLMVIPSGGGKTTIALELAFANALEGHKNAIIFTEQDPFEDPDIQLRQNVLCSQAPRDTWELTREKLQEIPDEDVLSEYEGIVNGILTPSQFSKWDKGKQIWRDNVTILDCVKNPITDLRAFLNSLGEIWEQNGESPYLLQMDWLGPLFNSLASSTRIRSDQHFRQLVQDSIQLLKNFATKWCLRLICYHQVAGSQVKQNSEGRPTASSFRGAESTMLPYLFTFAMAATTQFADKQFWFVADKMRSAAQGKRRLRMHGDLCVIKSVREEAGSLMHF